MTPHAAAERSSLDTSESGGGGEAGEPVDIVVTPEPTANALVAGLVMTHLRQEHPDQAARTNTQEVERALARACESVADAHARGVRASSAGERVVDDVRSHPETADVVELMLWAVARHFDLGGCQIPPAYADEVSEHLRTEID